MTFDAAGIGQLRTEDDLGEFVRQEVDGSGLAQRLAQVMGAFRRGTGNPNGTVAAKAGTAFLNDAGGAGTTLYVKEADNVAGDPTLGWVGK